MLSVLLLSLTCSAQTTQPVQPSLMYLVTPLGPWDNWYNKNLNRVKALGNELPVNNVIFLINEEDSFRLVSRALYQAGELGLNVIYGLRHTPNSHAEFSLMLNREWHNSRVKELRIINTLSYSIDTTYNAVYNLDELEMFTATQPWIFLRKKLFVIGSINQYTTAIALQARRGSNVSVIDYTLVDYDLALNPDRALSSSLQYWAAHRVIYIPGLFLVYRNDSIVMQKMARFGAVAFFPRTVEDDAVHFGLPEWNPIK